MSETAMFCYQCEQTAKGEGCTKIGVCGKQPDVSALQDLLVHALKGLSLYAVEGRKVGVSDPEINRFTCYAAFATLTNVNFDPESFGELIRKCESLGESLKDKVKAAGGDAIAGGGSARPLRASATPILPNPTRRLWVHPGREFRGRLHTAEDRCRGGTPTRRRCPRPRLPNR